MPGFSENNNSLDNSIYKFLIFDAIKKLYLDGIQKAFLDSDRFSTFSAKKTIALNKTEFWQLSSINTDEGIIAGIYKIYNNIYLEQLSLKAAEPGKSDNFIQN